MAKTGTAPETEGDENETKGESRIAQQEAKQGLSYSGKLSALARVVGILERFNPSDREWIITRLGEVVKEG